MEIILMDEILLITEQIRSYFPSCYAVLEETPVIFNDQGKDVRDNELKQYLESIQTQWHHLIGRAVS
jgi:hypothetical protein